MNKICFKFKKAGPVNQRSPFERNLKLEKNVLDNNSLELSVLLAVGQVDGMTYMQCQSTKHNLTRFMISSIAQEIENADFVAQNEEQTLNENIIII
jgi:hypothetical protein